MLRPCGSIEKKENIGIKNLYDSDIYDIVKNLKRQGIKSSYNDVECVLNGLLGR